MSRESRMFGGILLVVLPSVMFGGMSLLGMLTRNITGYNDNPLRHDLWRAGHAHAGVYIVLSLFLSVVAPTATQPNSLINLGYVGALFLAVAVLSLGVGLIRAARGMQP